MKRYVMGAESKAMSIWCSDLKWTELFTDRSELLQRIAELEQEGCIFMCSSSIDFPDESTSEDWILNFCYDLHRADQRKWKTVGDPDSPE